MNDPQDDTFRFYLCVEDQNRMNRYECTQVKADVVRVNAKEKRSIVVPISQKFPKIVDFMFINNALKPTFNIVK